MDKHDYQLLFKDSPEYYWVPNSRLIINADVALFLVFKEDTLVEQQFYPWQHIQRVKQLPRGAAPRYV